MNPMTRKAVSTWRRAVSSWMPKSLHLALQPFSVLSRDRHRFRKAANRVPSPEIVKSYLASIQATCTTYWTSSFFKTSFWVLFICWKTPFAPIVVTQNEEMNVSGPPLVLLWGLPNLFFISIGEPGNYEGGLLFFSQNPFDDILNIWHNNLIQSNSHAFIFLSWPTILLSLIKRSLS